MSTYRASPVQLRKALSSARACADNGIYFVVMPVLSKEDGAELFKQALARLDQLEKMADEE